MNASRNNASPPDEGSRVAARPTLDYAPARLKNPARSKQRDWSWLAFAAYFLIWLIIVLVFIFIGAPWIRDPLH